MKHVCRRLFSQVFPSNNVLRVVSQLTLSASGVFGLVGKAQTYQQSYLKNLFANMTTTVPSPPGLPILGNISDIDPQNSIASLCHLADIYGTGELVPPQLASPLTASPRAYIQAKPGRKRSILHRQPRVVRRDMR